MQVEDVTLEYNILNYLQMKMEFIVSTCMEYTISAIVYSTGKATKLSLLPEVLCIHVGRLPMCKRCI